MNNIVKNTLVIDLKSDLICGSGEGWSNIIDTDIVYDQYGFPYIPARRIRGLLKEAALELEEFGIFESNTSKKLFGDEENEGQPFILYNAFLKNIDDMRNEIKHIHSNYQKHLNLTSVLNEYTDIRYQTAINEETNEEINIYEGTNKTNSLRSSRAISKGNKFYAHMECSEENLDKIKKCLAMIHHMGINRTRGFGEVDLYLEKYDFITKTQMIELEDNKYYELKLMLENKTQLSIVNTKGEKSLDYITGSSILGYFANSYLKRNQLKEADSRFYDLFVKGNVKFSNAYISDDNWNVYYPVRESLYKEKTGTNYYDKSVDEVGNEILSKVRGKYLSNNFVLKEVNKEMYYHHRRPTDKSVGHVISNDNIDDGMFYQLEVISAEQKFISFIRGYGKDLKDVIAGLPPYIQIGKSKYTQYGNIQVCGLECKEVSNKILKAGSEVLYTFLSPVLLFDEKRESDLNIEHLASTLHLKDVKPYIGYTSIGGYNSKWRLQKPTYTAFSSGSCLRGTLIQDVEEVMVIGALTQEGLGLVKVEEVNHLKNKSISTSIENHEHNLEPKYTKNIVVSSLKHELYLESLNAIKKIKVSHILTNTLNGRLLKMLEKPTWEEFLEDASGIADVKKNREVNELIKIIENTCNDLYNKSLLTQFGEEMYIYKFYRQTLKELLLKTKVERRD